MNDPLNRNRPEWKADKTNPEMVASLTEGLKDIIDPEIGLNIIQLGLIRDVIIEDDHAELKMILTTPFCPYGPAMLDMTQKKAEEVLKLNTSINLGMDVWDFSMMEEGLADDWGLY